MSLPKNTIRISFDLDLTDFPAVRPDTREDIHASLQNLGAWLHNLSTYYATDAFSWSAKQSEMSEEMYQHLIQQSKLARQIFNNYKVEGTMADGTRFVHTHTEPDYKESLTYPDDKSEDIL